MADIGTWTVALLGLPLLVIVHETGHYLVARLFGMKVLRYSIGVGPVLARWQPKDSPTTFQVCLVPALAYVQIAGMNPFEQNDPEDPTLYVNKGLLARAATVAAGPAANYLFASALIFALALTMWPVHAVGEVRADSPAAVAGFRVGDLVIEANGERVVGWADLIRVTAPRAGVPTEYVVERGGEVLRLSATPSDVEGRGIIGIVSASTPIYRSLTLPEASRAALVLPFAQTVAQLEGIADLFKRRTTEGLSGPVAMSKMLASQAKRGVIDYAFMLLALSVALGMFNLLPFPALDGGRLVFLGYEAVTRRRPNERFEAVVHTVGIVVLLGLFAFVTAREIFFS